MARPIKIKKLDSVWFKLDDISSSNLERLRDKFSFVPPGYKYNPRFRLMGMKAIKVHMIATSGVFPSGLFEEIVSIIMDELRMDVELTKELELHFAPLTDEIDIKHDDKVFSDEGYEFREYQMTTLVEAFKWRYGILNLSTGAGKCLGPNTMITVDIGE